MNNNLTWKISTGVLAIALVALNVVAPALEQKKSEKLASGVVEFLGGYETASQEEKQVKLSNATKYINESSSNAPDARADFQASNGAYTTGGCGDFLVAYNSLAGNKALSETRWLFLDAYYECTYASTSTPPSAI